LKLVARDRVSRRRGRQSCPERRGPIESDRLGEDHQVVRVVEGWRRLDGAELGILFVGDRRMKYLNRVYRNVDRTTDVLSFPLYNSREEMPCGVEFLLGDVVINPHQARKQADACGAGFNEEMRRLLIHGFLHLLGYDHERTPYEARKMKKAEKALRRTLETLA